MRYYLAVDIGASSGRHILGCVDNGGISVREIYRFDNSVSKNGSYLCWDTEYLLSQVIEGLRVCGQIKIIPESVSIDTWGVDYVLLNNELNEVMPAISYRDPRTEGLPTEVDSIIARDELYSRTGIQTQAFNTIYQLICDNKCGRSRGAKHFLMMPEYLSFKLCGVIANEYTNATTTGLVNANQKQWDNELINQLGIDPSIFKPLTKCGTVLGNLTDEIMQTVGFDTKVMLAPSHDTASAIAAIPLEDDAMYISSGTWSLVGIESQEPLICSRAQQLNYTNEGGIEYRFRFLKNIMGMWLFQSIRKELDNKYTYDEMMRMAMESSYKRTIDLQDSRFTAPDSMIDEIKSYLGEPNLSLADLISCVYHSLAKSYKWCVDEIESITGKSITSINIVGGGSKDKHLNTLTARYTNKPVFTGLTEATALGNILCQLMADRSMTLSQARQLVKTSFNIKELDVDEQI